MVETKENTTSGSIVSKSENENNFAILYPSLDKLSGKARIRLDEINGSLEQLTLRWNPEAWKETESAELIMKNGERKILKKLGRMWAPEADAYRCEPNGKYSGCTLRIAGADLPNISSLDITIAK